MKNGLLQAVRMSARCECHHDLGDHRRGKDGTFLGCIHGYCSCMEYCAPPANTTHIRIAVEKMKHAALLEDYGN